MKTINPQKTFSPISDPAFEQDFFYAKETYIHPTAQVGPHVTLGSGVKIGPYAIVTGNVSIGDNTHIYSHAVIGTPAQDRSVTTPLGRVVIGKNVIIKDFVTISAATKEGGATTIGDNCYCMHFSHIAHDATLEEFVTLTNNAQVAGHVYVEKHALLMAHTMVHQWCRIGAYSALAPFSGCRQDIPPYSLYTKLPAAFTGLNRVRLQRIGAPRDSVRALQAVTRLFYREKLPFQKILDTCQERGLYDDTYVKTFLTFIEQSKRGVSRQSLLD